MAKSFPESLCILQQAAQATKQSLDQIIFRVVWIGSPPGWDDIPAEYQTDLTTLEHLDNTALWRIAREHQTEADFNRYQDLLDINRNRRRCSFILWVTSLPANQISVCFVKRIDDCDAAYPCNRTAKSEKLVTVYLIGPTEVMQNFGNWLTSDRMSSVVG